MMFILMSIDTGTGPGGATAARLLALNAPSWEILVLEAGEDRDTDEPIMNSRYASVVADQYFPQVIDQRECL